MQPWAIILLLRLRLLPIPYLVMDGLLGKIGGKGEAGNGSGVLGGG
jgi:hypothetical protein